MIYFSNEWQKQLRLTTQLEAARKRAELQLLQSQVKPHFIFNTLNNIYTLSLKGAPQAPEMIHKLSALLRYMLYDSRQDKIPLHQELSYIDDYLALEKLRYNGNLDVLINHFDDTAGVTIPPFILLPLVENCIKHGASQELGLSWIRLDVSTADGWLAVTIENSKGGTPHVDLSATGIGINNVKERLALIYPQSHSFTIIDEADSFTVLLRLKYKSVQDEHDGLCDH